MSDDPRQSAIDALQETVILVGHLRATALGNLDDLSRIKLALERAIAALRSDDPRRV